MAIMMGKDKYMQPILLIRIRLVNPKATTEDRMRRFIFYTLEYMIRNLPKDGDRYSAIFDFKGAGLSNMNMKQIKEMAPVIQDCYPERTYKIFVVNANWLLKIVWGIVKPFLDPCTVTRVHLNIFLGGD